MKFKLIATDKLIEHPENKRLFKDIRDTNPSFWIEFKESIKQFGVLEPLIVNEDTMEVRSGNQRLKAAIELGIEELPIVLITDEDSEIEIKKMIASNVYRRTIDAFSMFEYIGKLRNDVTNVTYRDIAKEIHKDKSFISAADIFNKLPHFPGLILLYT